MTGGEATAVAKRGRAAWGLASRFGPCDQAGLEINAVSSA